MKNTQAIEFCNQWLAAWTGNQPNFYADDAYYLDPAKPNGLTGKNEIHRYFIKLLAKYPNWTWNMIEVFPHESGFILKWEARLNPRTTDVFFGLDIVEICSGKIIRNEVYFDPSKLTQIPIVHE